MESLMKMKQQQQQQPGLRPEDAIRNAENDNGPPEIDPDSIEIQSEIGTGSFGKVFRGRCRQKDVAIKVLHKQHFDAKTMDTFRREVKIMSKIFHPNICLFMGACTVPGKCMIVTELFPLGNLETMLHNKKISLNMVTRMKMARDAAYGMNWLHCSNPVIIHRDLKSSNLLVDEKLVIKVCDFGLSQFIPPDQKIKDKQNAKGTPLWMAPEVMSFKEFNEKCDIYSFGIVLWEILTREEPFAEYTNFDKFKEAVVVRHERPPIPEDTIPSLKNLIKQCWDKDPNARPTFEKIITDLDAIIVESAIADPNARTFWKKYFLKEDHRPWKEFLGCLVQFLKIPDDENKENNLIALKAVLAEHGKAAELDDVVEIEHFGKIVDWFSPFDVSTPENVDNAFLDRIRKLLMKGWFHGYLGAEEAQARLDNMPAGSFLVRFSERMPGSYAISSIGNDSLVRHQRIQHDSLKGYQFREKWYPSIEDIIKDVNTFYIPASGSKFTGIFSKTPIRRPYVD